METTTKPTVSVGDFFVESWGYDQTNVDFYQVVKVSASGQTIWMRHVQAQVVRGRGPADYVAPLPDAFTEDGFGRDWDRGQVLRKKVRVWADGSDKFRVSVHMTSYSNAYLWDCKPEYQTAIGWGH